MEVKHVVCSYSEDIWTRLLASGVMVFLPIQEIVAGSVIKSTEHVSLFNELYFLVSVFSVVVNDIYSYTKEMRLDVIICNIVQTIAGGKEASTEYDAVIKCVEILNAVVKIMYQKIEKAKQKNPANQDLWKLLDNIGMNTVGWYYFNHYSPHYDDSFGVSLSLRLKTTSWKNGGKAMMKNVNYKKYYLYCSTVAQEQRKSGIQL